MTKPIDRTVLELKLELKGMIDEFVAAKDIVKHLADLKKIADKQYFYTHYTFEALLEVLSTHRDLPEPKVNAVFALLNGILFNGPDKKDTILSLLYCFIDKNKKRLDLLDNLISMCASEKEIITTTPNIFIAIRNILVMESATEKQRKCIYKSYQAFLRTHAADSSLVHKQLEYFNRLVNFFLRADRREDLVPFLTDTILHTASRKDLMVMSDEIIEQLFTTLTLLLSHGHTESAMDLGKKLTKAFDKLLTNDDQRNCNSLLMKVFKMCSAGTFSEAAFRDIHSNHFKKPKATQSDWHQKIVVKIAKLLSSKLALFEMSPGCFEVYQHLVVGFFYTFKTIPNREDSFTCCADVKRHESHNAIRSVYSLVVSLIKEGQFNEIVAKRLIYHAKYDTQLCSDLKCESKHNELLKTYSTLYSVLFALHSDKSIIHKYFNQIHDLLKILFKLWNSIPDDDKAANMPKPDALTLEIYAELKREETAKISAKGLASLLIYQIRNTGDYSSATKESKRLLMSSARALREATKQLKFNSASEFIESDQFKDGDFSSNKRGLPVAEFILTEMSSAFRYCPSGVEAIGQLFGKLCAKTKDPRLLAEACQVINESTLKYIDAKVFRKVNELLEARAKKLLDLKEFDVGNSLALALNNYSTYIKMSESVISELKENKTASLTELNLQAELDQLKYLNKSLEHFTDVVRHLEKQRQDVDKITSKTRVQSILNNIAHQYFLRGIEYKDLETFTLLWIFVQLDSSPAAPTDNSTLSGSDSSKQSAVHILHVATVFLDHRKMLTDPSGNYVKLSEEPEKQKMYDPLTIDIILDGEKGAIGANQALDNELIPSFDNLTKSLKFYVLSYVLSLWVYYVTNGKRAAGFKRYEQFKKMWMSVSSSQEFLPNRAIIEAKLHFCCVEIDLECSDRYTADYLSIACSKIMSIQSFEKDFSYQFYQIFHRTLMEAIVRSNNRLADMDHYNSAMLSLIQLAIRKGFCLKALDLISLSITRYLNMEKIGHAMTQLQKISKLLGLNEEILIETGTKSQSVTTLLEYATAERIRKQVVAPPSPIQCELSVINENDSPALSDQLKSFVHPSSCRCEICKTPQLKFIMFQIGCHYARLLWLVGKFDVSLKFYELAFKEYLEVSNKLRSSSNPKFLMLNGTHFTEHSIRWLLQYVDTLIRLEEYDECDDILLQVQHNCTRSLPDYECLNEALCCRKENVDFLRKFGLMKEEKKQETGLTFEDFLNARLDAQRAKSGDKSKVANNSKAGVSTKAGDLTKAGSSTKAGDPTKAGSSTKAGVSIKAGDPTKAGPKGVVTTIPEDKKTKQKSQNLEASLKRPVSVMATPITEIDDVVYVDSDDDSYLKKPATPKNPAPKSVKRPISTRRMAKIVEDVIEVDLTNDSSSDSASSIPASARKTRRRI